MTRYEMERKVKDYITSDTHKLEDYSDIEICCEADREEALRLMDEKVEHLTDLDLKSFCNAIDTNTVSYMIYGCR